MRISGYDANAITSLFSNFNRKSSDHGNRSSEVGNFTSVLSEYNSVKSGSYYKLLKKYYAQNTDTGASGRVSRKATSSSDVKGTVSKAVVNAAEDATDLSNSIKKLRDSSLYEKDAKEIYAAVKDYVSDYNSMVKSGEKSSVSGVSTNTARLKDVSDYNKVALEKIGITIGADHSLSLDEETWKKADMKDVKELFTGSGYGSAQASNASLIGYYAKAAASTGGYQRNGMYSVPSAYDFSSYV